MIKNLIFDIGGVLVDFRLAGVLKDMGISEERAVVLLVMAAVVIIGGVLLGRRKRNK